MKKDYTHITLLVDRSGSMYGILADSQGGINEFVKAHKEAPGQCTFALYEFDNVFDTAFAPANISTFESYTLEPRGNTALYDAQMKAINLTGAYLRELPEDQRPERVIFVTVTDGGENASREHRDPSAIKKKITEQQDKYSWEFIYLGANQDAFAVGQSMGIYRTVSYAGTGAAAASSYVNMTASTLNARAKGMDSSALLATSVAADGTLEYGDEKKDNVTTSNGDNK